MHDENLLLPVSTDFQEAYEETVLLFGSYAGQQLCLSIALQRLKWSLRKSIRWLIP